MSLLCGMWVPDSGTSGAYYCDYSGGGGPSDGCVDYVVNGTVVGSSCDGPPNGPEVNPGGGQQGQNTNPANNQTPWYHNSCITGALKSGAVSVGVDALGFLPEAGGVARVVGHQAGYVGKVADNVGKNMLTAGTKTAGVLSSATGFSSSDPTTWVLAAITAADFVPVLSDFTTPAAIIWDAGVAAYKVYQCPK
jgi:hypothetical protein